MAYLRYRDFYKNGWLVDELSEHLKNGDRIDITLAEYITDACDLDTETVVQNDSVFDVIGGEGTYLTVSRPSIREPFIFCGACHKASEENASHEFRRKVYVCSPFRGRTDWERNFHIWAARYIGKGILQHGNIPVAPHLYYPQLLDDGKPADRELALGLGRLLLRECDRMIICRIDGYISDGMAQEIAYAANHLDIEINEISFKDGVLQEMYRGLLEADSGSDESDG